MLDVDKILALNAEIVALRAARIPVDLDLPRSESQAKRQLNAVDAELRHQVAAGQSTEQAFDVALADVPIKYRQVLWAGSRSGQLSGTMETISRHLQRLRDVRTSIATSLVYPLIVCILAYCFFVLLCTTALPRLHELYADMMGEDVVSSSLWMFSILRRRLTLFLTIPPLSLLLLLLFWWRGERLGVNSTEDSLGLLAWLPGFRRVVRDVQLAGIADIAATLVPRNMPATQAVNTASRAVLGKDYRGKAPFLDWAIERDGDSSIKVESSLRLASDLYEERAEQRAEWLRFIVPYGCIVFVAGGAVLFYAVTFWRPFCQFMTDISAYSIL